MSKELENQKLCMHLKNEILTVTVDEKREFECKNKGLYFMTNILLTMNPETRVEKLVRDCVEKKN